MSAMWSLRNTFGILPLFLDFSLGRAPPNVSNFSLRGGNKVETRETKSGELLMGREKEITNEDSGTAKSRKVDSNVCSRRARL